MEVIIVALGGAIGSALRYILSQKVNLLSNSDFPYAIMVVNVVGCLIMGIMAGFFGRYPASPDLRLLLTVGVMGGFTTFSAFSLDVFILLEKGDIKGAAIYILGSVGLSLIAFAVGMFSVRYS